MIEESKILNQFTDRPEKNLYNIDGGSSSNTAYQIKYGDFVGKTLIPQISRIAAEKMTVNPIKFGFNYEVEKIEKKVNKILDNIFSFFDFNEIYYVTEQTLSLDGYTTIVWQKQAKGRYSFFAPNVSITQVDPGSGELDYLQIIRFLKGGNFLNIINQIWTNGEVITNFESISGYTGNTPTNNKEYDVFKKKNINKIKKIKREDFLKTIDNVNERKKIEKETETYSYSDIPAIYLQNLPSKDFRGFPDVDRNNSYTDLLNKIFVRYHWEFDFNKSKLIEHQEIGTNPVLGLLNNDYRKQAVEENFAILKNNYWSPNSDGRDSMEFFETSNTNLQPITFFFNYILKKWWEHSGHHMSGSDVGKQITDLQIKHETSFEERRYKWKVASRIKKMQLMLWKVLNDYIQSEEEEEELKKAFLEIYPNNFEVSIAPYTVELQETLIENTIKKIQANLMDRDGGIKALQPTLSTEEIKKQVNDILDNNLDDLEKVEKLKQNLLPVQVQSPNISNPQGATNNQLKTSSTSPEKNKSVKSYTKKTGKRVDNYERSN